MTSMRSHLQRALCAGLVNCAAAAVQAQVPTGPDVVLVHGFRIPNGDSWGSISIDLPAGGWRVGDAGGPPASEAQLRQVLRALVAVALGGRCAGWVDGATAYPCGFSLRNIDWAGSVTQPYAAIAVDQQSVVVAARQHAEVGLSLEPDSSSPSASPRVDDERFVAMRLPMAYLGDKSQTLGGVLQFEIRALSNLLAPSRFEYGSGLVVLRARLLGERS
jgi:hypothetical protein